MNFFEGELRKLFGDGKIISTPSFTGLACLGTLDKDLRIRAQFVTTGYADHYDALKLTVLNRTDGPVDTLLLRFRDIWGRKPVPGNPNFPSGVSPHIWTCDGRTEWYAWSPAQADRGQLIQQIQQYLEPFRERTPERGHDGPKLVYICAPLRGDVANNIEFAQQKAQEVFQSGDIPVCPHITLPSNADPACSVQDEAAREMGLRLLESCHQINVYGSTITEGMRAEIRRAQDQGIPIVFGQEPPQRVRPRKQIVRKGGHER
ncbi:DUF4406 domain-containing protein [uncultured Oscillibacter sp.]|uniref:DUF7768 domain-containing protein n=1 Tax=uncultured Oscillibacter sp. TaxID=876091 RepID=UPI00266F5B5C|nr:DUF4406 domain-containing protein [uncultured Oscillibacter sp.]